MITSKCYNMESCHSETSKHVSELQASVITWSPVILGRENTSQNYKQVL